jgi:hypothetical protein
MKSMSNNLIIIPEVEGVVVAVVLEVERPETSIFFLALNAARGSLVASG